MEENSHLDKKSLTLVSGTKANWKELAKDCVCFANGVGGKILIGIEDDRDEPTSLQKIDDLVLDKIAKTIPALTHNVGIIPIKRKSENGGEYIELQVLRSIQSVASTTDGKYYMRISDECKPILPEDLNRLMSEKNAFVWEEKVARKILIGDCDLTKYEQFLRDIKSSERVSSFVKEMSDNDIADYYFLSQNGYLTNLGILWIGKRTDRAVIHYPPAVQFIKYDEQDKKVYKKVWD